MHTPIPRSSPGTQAVSPKPKKPQTRNPQAPQSLKSPPLCPHAPSTTKPAPGSSRGSDLPHGLPKWFKPQKPENPRVGHIGFGWKSKSAWRGPGEAEEGPGASATGGFRGAAQRFGIESSRFRRHRDIRTVPEQIHRAECWTSYP